MRSMSVIGTSSPSTTLTRIHPPTPRRPTLPARSTPDPCTCWYPYKTVRTPTCALSRSSTEGSTKSPSLPKRSRCEKENDGSRGQDADDPAQVHGRREGGQGVR